jgi:hypothetical protein
MDQSSHGRDGHVILGQAKRRRFFSKVKKQPICAIKHSFF